MLGLCSRWVTDILTRPMGTTMSWSLVKHSRRLSRVSWWNVTKCLWLQSLVQPRWIPLMSFPPFKRASGDLVRPYVYNTSCFYVKIKLKPGSLMPKVLARVALHPLDTCFWNAFNDLMLWCYFTKWSNKLVATRSDVSTLTKLLKISVNWSWSTWTFTWFTGLWNLRRGPAFRQERRTSCPWICGALGRRLRNVSTKDLLRLSASAISMSQFWRMSCLLPRSLHLWTRYILCLFFFFFFL